MTCAGGGSGIFGDGCTEFGNNGSNFGSARSYINFDDDNNF